MAHEHTIFEALQSRTLPREVMQLPDIDLALVWLTPVHVEISRTWRTRTAWAFW